MKVLTLRDLPWFDPGLSSVGFFISNLQDFKCENSDRGLTHSSISGKDGGHGKLHLVEFHLSGVTEHANKEIIDGAFKTQDQIIVAELF